MPRKARSKSSDVESQLAQLAKYEAFFAELTSFTDFINETRIQLRDALAAEAEAKHAFEAARDKRHCLENALSGAKDSVYHLVAPGVQEYLPLLDRMEPADPKKHGAKSAQWRTEPIVALGLSPNATRCLVEVDIVVVGQLQDRVLASPEDWYLAVDGMTLAVAAAVVDQLNDFIFNHEQGES